MFKSPFFRRLFLPYLLLVCAAIGILGFLEARHLRQNFLDRSEQGLRDQSRLMAELIAPNVQPRRPAELNQQISRLGQSLGCRVTVIETDGTVVADNEADPATMENHRLRPEVSAAISQGEGSSARTSATTHDGLLYFARRIDAPDSSSHILRLAVHLRQLERELAVLYSRLASTGLIAMLVAGIICYLFARHHSAPLVELTAFAGALSDGQLHRRIRPAASGEVATLAAALNAMAESLSRLIAQADKDKAELLAILSSMTEGVIATDTQQRIRLFNAAAIELLDLGDAPVEGRLLWEVIRHQELMKVAAEVLATGTARTFPVGPVAGRRLEVTVCTFPPSAQPAGLVIVTYDVTESVRYQDLRKEFVANVSHELRTPLSVVKGFTETLRDGALHDPVKGPQFLATIEKHADQLTNLVNDLLDLSRLESHPALPQCGPVDLALTAESVVEALRPAAQKKSQALTMSISPNVPPLSGNADYLERAVSNLVDNAIKYTPVGGSVGLAVTVEDGAILLRVSDNGIGIPDAELPRIFERFYRVDRSRSREMGGTGLGLSIVKHVVQAHGGSIEVSSTPAAGTIFTLRFPLR